MSEAEYAIEANLDQGVVNVGGALSGPVLETIADADDIGAEGTIRLEEAGDSRDVGVGIAQLPAKAGEYGHVAVQDFDFLQGATILLLLRLSGGRRR